ncbi:MAG: membrane protein insertase YidC [Campylobacterota bacterium]|nr:membrane protein insertase YidC [Campylobacterota bacterium]
MEQLDLQKRLIIALALSFLVFVGSSYFMGGVQPAGTAQESNQTAQNQKVNNQAPAPVSSGSASKAPATQKSAATAAPIKDSSKALATVMSEISRITIDEFGRISQVVLLEEKYRDDDGSNLKLLDPAAVKPLEIRFSDAALNEEAFKVPYQASASALSTQNAPATITLTQNLTDLTVTKEITFYADGHYDLHIKTSKPVDYFLTTGARPIADTSMYMLVKGALVKGSDGIITTIEDGDAAGDETFNNALFAAAIDRYYASVLYDLKKGLNVTVAKGKEDDPLIFVKGESDSVMQGYIGPKEYSTLKALSPELTDVIEYGWFTFMSKPFFAVIVWIHGFVGNWGWAIILFTLLVKIILFPLSYKGMMSMQKLKDLAPKMKELKEKYGKDPQKMNAKMMEMYKKHGANPMGGCLPMLLQIPVFFALYRVLLNADELQGAPWILWIQDLSRMDPYFVLPVLMGASMYFQQKITPSNITDPLQEKIFKFFPVIMTVFFVTFPSGLVLYWLTNNILSIGQQYYINIAYEKHKAAAIAAHDKSQKEQ